MRPKGNTGLHEVDYRNRTASFGILIGEPECRGKGYGTETTRLMLDYAFTALGLHNVMLIVFEFNAAGMVGTKKRKELAAELRALFAATSGEQALRFASEVADRWRRKGHEKVAEHLEEHIEECLACLSFPESHRRRIRTTNGLERLNQELKRRSRVVRILPNRHSCLRLVTALAVEQSEEWLTGRRYLDMEELREHRHSEECEAEELRLVER